MSIQDFIDFLMALGLETPIYPLAFPTSAPNSAIMVEIGQGFNSRGDVIDVTLTTTVRGKHPKDSEALAQEINQLLTDLTDQPLGDTNIILIKSQQFIPNYLGKDAKGLHYYMNNFRVLVDS